MRHSKSNLLFAFGITTLAFFILWGVSSMTVNETGAGDAAATMGFSEVEVLDSGFFFTSLRGCDEKDLSWYKVKAVNSNGDNVNLRVCRGLFKGYTVRVK